MNCLFCKMINKEVPADIIYEDNNAIGILDINPVAPGHTMVISKFHSENILNLPNDKIGGIFIAVKQVVAILNKSLESDNFTIGINHGKVSGQVIDHLHIHIIPRFKDDKGGSIHSVVDNSPKESLGEIMAKILNPKS